MSEKLAEQLRTAIAGSGLSILAISKICGITYSRLHDFINGGDIKLSTAQKLIDYFGVKARKPKRK